MKIISKSGSILALFCVILRLGWKNLAFERIRLQRVYHGGFIEFRKAYIAVGEEDNLFNL
jgi:hypothetical protein